MGIFTGPHLHFEKIYERDPRLCKSPFLPSIRPHQLEKTPTEGLVFFYSIIGITCSVHSAFVFWEGAVPGSIVLCLNIFLRDQQLRIQQRPPAAPRICIVRREHDEFYIHHWVPRTTARHPVAGVVLRGCDGP